MASWRIEVTRPVPSLNWRLKWRGMHRETKRWEDIFAGFKQVQRIPDAKERRIVKITRWHGIDRIKRTRNQKMDYDNFVGGCKPIVDAMVRTGLLLGDDEKHLTIEYWQRRTDEWSKVVFEIEEVPHVKA